MMTPTLSTVGRCEADVWPGQVSRHHYQWRGHFWSPIVITAMTTTNEGRSQKYFINEENFKLTCQNILRSTESDPNIWCWLNIIDTNSQTRLRCVLSLLSRLSFPLWVTLADISVIESMTQAGKLADKLARWQVMFWQSRWSVSQQ